MDPEPPAFQIGIFILWQIKQYRLIYCDEVFQGRSGSSLSGKKGCGLKKTRIILPVLIAVFFFAGTACQTLSGPGTKVPGTSRIYGQIVQKETGLPVQGAHVYAYVDFSKNLIGVADYVSKGSKEDGSYQLELPPGEYYLVARRRNSGANYGPIVTGDLYDHGFQQEAVRVEPDRDLERNFEVVELREPMFFQVFTEAQRKTGTGIHGRILDLGKEPVQGAFATAYMDSNMKRLPDFVSTLSGDDGTFTLYLPGGGKWYIGARSRARAAPVPGEPVGRYGGSDDHSILVTEDSFVEGIEIILKPFSSQVPAGYSPY